MLNNVCWTWTQKDLVSMIHLLVYEAPSHVSPRWQSVAILMLVGWFEGMLKSCCDTLRRSGTLILS